MVSLPSWSGIGTWGQALAETTVELFGGALVDVEGDVPTVVGDEQDQSSVAGRVDLSWLNELEVVLVGASTGGV